jgi:transmembrane sensor
MDSSERRERAAEEAAEWMLRLTSADMTRAERAEYVQWLQESPMHVAEMLRVAQVHNRLTEYPDWKEIPPVEPSVLVAQVRQLPVGDATAAAGTDVPTFRTSEELAASVDRPLHWRWWPWLPAIAGVLAIVLSYVTFVRSNTIVAKPGHWREAKLPDGSLVQLGPRSALTVHFSALERNVELLNGDALFTVAKDPTKPFIVHSGQTRVRAVGTVFGVERDDRGVIVTVEEGRVAVLDSAEKSFARAPQPIAVTEISLGADQQIIVPAGAAMGAPRNVDSRRELAWAEGRLVVDDETVADVVRRFNRFNRVQLKVLDPQLAARSVTAVFDAADPDAFIIFLESVANVRVTRTSSTEVLITSEGPH